MHVLSSNSRTHKFKSHNAQKVVRKCASLQEFRVAMNIVAAAQGLDPDLVLGQSRSEARIALCRQLAMYVAHVCLGYSQSFVGQLFHRDRSTVAHACARIEDMRDDKSFDETLNHLEQVLGFAHTMDEAARKELGL